MKNVTDGDDLMIVNKSGIIIRLNVNNIRIAGRATQGVKLINLKDGANIADVAKVEKSEVVEKVDLESDKNITNNEEQEKSKITKQTLEEIDLKVDTK